MCVLSATVRLRERLPLRHGSHLAYDGDATRSVAVVLCEHGYLTEGGLHLGLKISRLMFIENIDEIQHSANECKQQ